MSAIDVDALRQAFCAKNGQTTVPVGLISFVWNEAVNACAAAIRDSKVTPDTMRMGSTLLIDNEPLVLAVLKLRDE